jgi:hypothetical protein
VNIHLQLLCSKRQCPVARSGNDGFCQALTAKGCEACLYYCFRSLEALTAKGCEPCLYYCFRSLEAQLQGYYPSITIGMQDLRGVWWLVLLEGAVSHAQSSTARGLPITIRRYADIIRYGTIIANFVAYRHLRKHNLYTIFKWIYSLILHNYKPYY